MKRVITYGTYDLLHFGHLKLLERAKKMGDYLIVGVTSDDYDKTRGKINVQQSLVERIEAVRATGLADKIIVEEYEGQKIDDIKKYGVDIFTVGSDWKGKFDYLNEYCEVIYLERTKGVSSSEIRAAKRALSMGLVGNHVSLINKFQAEDIYVNGVEIIGVCTDKIENMSNAVKELSIVTENYDELLKSVDSVYIVSDCSIRYEQIKKALLNGKHVLCESPICLETKQCQELVKLAKEKKCILMESIKTAYATAYNRLILLLKLGKIGKVLSIEANCTSIKENKSNNEICSLKEWGPTALLPIFDFFGTNYKSKTIITRLLNKERRNDAFTRINFIYENAVATINVAEKAKKEGDLVITGTDGYLYVPAPWWKTEYFEVRYENSSKNKRYYYQLDGEGIRYEMLMFIRSIQEKKNLSSIDINTTIEITKIISEFEKGTDVIEI